MKHLIFRCSCTRARLAYYLLVQQFLSLFINVNVCQEICARNVSRNIAYIINIVNDFLIETNSEVESKLKVLFMYLLT